MQAKLEQQRPAIQPAQQLDCKEVVPDTKEQGSWLTIKDPSPVQVFFHHQVASSLSPLYTLLTTRPFHLLIIMKTNTLFTLTFVVGLLVSSSIAAPISTKSRVSKRDEVPAGCPGTLRGPSGNAYYGEFNGDTPYKGWLAEKVLEYPQLALLMFSLVIPSCVINSFQLHPEQQGCTAGLRFLLQWCSR